MDAIRPTEPPETALIPLALRVLAIRSRVEDLRENLRNAEAEMKAADKAMVEEMAAHDVVTATLGSHFFTYDIDALNEHNQYNLKTYRIHVVMEPDA